MGLGILLSLLTFPNKSSSAFSSEPGSPQCRVRVRVGCPLCPRQVIPAPQALEWNTLFLCQPPETENQLGFKSWVFMDGSTWMTSKRDMGEEAAGGGGLNVA